MRLAVVVLGVGLVGGLSGCSGVDSDELTMWMEQQRAQAKPGVAPIAEPKKFMPQAYEQDAVIDPFSNQKLTQALRRDSAQVTSNVALINPELARRKEPLEAFPLDAIVMVGSLVKQGQPVALVRADNLLYQAKVGGYLGQNYGKILKIAETEIVLREVVQDSAGEWTERPVTLQLQEGSK